MSRWNHLVRLADDELRRYLRALPPDVRAKAEAVEVVFERHPSDALVEEGYEPDLMGLFEGPSLSEPEGVENLLPRRILLFLDNIWEEAEGDDRTYRDEVRTTLLHELGHYLGLDEDELAERDLE